MSRAIPPRVPGVSVDLVDDFAADLQAQVERLEQAIDNVVRETDRANDAAAALVELLASMRREAERARGGRGAP
jgi:hypothetical protein